MFNNFRTNFLWFIRNDAVVGRYHNDSKFTIYDALAQLNLLLINGYPRHKSLCQNAHSKERRRQLRLGKSLKVAPQVAHHQTMSFLGFY